VLHRLRGMLPKKLLFALILALVVVLTQLLGQAGTALVDWTWKKGHRVSAVDGMLEFLVAALCVATVFWIGHARPRPSRGMAGIRAVVAAGAVVASNTFLNTVGSLVGECVGDSAHWWTFLLVLLVWAWGWVALVCLPRVEKWFQAQVDRCPEEEARYGPGHIVLVMLVSTIADDSIDVATGRVCDRHLAFESLDADVERLEKTRWPWQQLMRGISPVVKRAAVGDRTTIVLIGSSGDQGSFRKLGTCIELLTRYPALQDEARARVRSSAAYLEETAPHVGLQLTSGDIADHGVDFEDFNAVRQHVLMVAHVAACEVGGDRVVVDVTGGQKTTSIAAAVATTGETGFCQYVQTNPPNKVVWYDLHPPELPVI